jgi:hypothetical protein
MSGRSGTNRTIGVDKFCAVLIRGGMQCAWCGVAFRGQRPDDAAETPTVDHLDGDPGNNAPTNHAAAHLGCNRARAWDWVPGKTWTPQEAMRAHAQDVDATFGIYLEAKRAHLAAGIARAEAQRHQDLDLVAGRQMAARWYPKRREQVRAAQKAYQARKRAEKVAAT